MNTHNVLVFVSILFCLYIVFLWCVSRRRVGGGGRGRGGEKGGGWGERLLPSLRGCNVVELLSASRTGVDESNIGFHIYLRRYTRPDNKIFHFALFINHHNNGEGDPRQYASPEWCYRLQRCHPADLYGEGFNYGHKEGFGYIIRNT